MKFSIIGASGKVANQIIQSSFLFNKCNDLELVCISGNPELVSARVLDFASAEPMLSVEGYSPPLISVSDDYSCLSGSHAIFVCAGQFPTDENAAQYKKIDPSGRLALTFGNVPLIREITTKIQQFCPHANLIIVTNQSDIISEVAREIHQSDKVFGFGGMLDEARFRTVLSGYLNASKNLGERIRPSQILTEIVGFHNDDMVLVRDSLGVSGCSNTTALKTEKGFVADAFKQTVRYGRLIARHRDPRLPSVDTGAAVGPGVACWAVIKALSGQTSPIKASFNTLTHSQVSQNYGLTDGTALSVPLIISEAGFTLDNNVARCSDSEIHNIQRAVKNMRDQCEMVLGK